MLQPIWRFKDLAYCSTMRLSKQVKAKQRAELFIQSEIERGVQKWGFDYIYTDLLRGALRGTVQEVASPSWAYSVLEGASDQARLFDNNTAGTLLPFEASDRGDNREWILGGYFFRYWLAFYRLSTHKSKASGTTPTEPDRQLMLARVGGVLRGLDKVFGLQQFEAVAACSLLAFQQDLEGRQALANRVTTHLDHLHLAWTRWEADRFREMMDGNVAARFDDTCLILATNYSSFGIAHPTVK